MLEEYNILVKSFRMARDRYCSDPDSAFRLRIIRSRERDGRQYNMPTADSEENFEHHC